MQINKFQKSRFINSAIIEGDVGKIELYGDVYETQPIDWWTGKPIEGYFITLDDFKESLNKVKNCSRIQLHLNSYGGDATVGLTIRNLLKATGKKITCVIDGIAASAAFTIACGADEVQVYKGSIMMCHKVMSLIFGFYNNDELQQVMNGNDAYDKASAAVYAAKTGMSEQQCLNLMAKSTWMTGQQALDYGFADVMLEDENHDSKVELVNNTTLSVNGVKHNISNMNVPDEILRSMTAKNTGGNEMADESKLQKFFNLVSDFFKNEVEEAPAEGEGNEAPAESEEEQAPAEEQKQNEAPAEGEGNEAPAEGEEEGNEEESEVAVQNAVNAERQRLQAIDEMAAGIDAELVQEAKYGATACDAAELALRAKQKEDEKKQSALEKMQSDSNSSKVNDVASAPAPKDDVDLDDDTKIEQAVDEMYKKLQQSKEGK